MQTAVIYMLLVLSNSWMSAVWVYVFQQQLEVCSLGVFWWVAAAPALACQALMPLVPTAQRKPCARSYQSA